MISIPPSETRGGGPANGFHESDAYVLAQIMDLVHDWRREMFADGMRVCAFAESGLVDISFGES